MMNRLSFLEKICLAPMVTLYIFPLTYGSFIPCFLFLKVRMGTLPLRLLSLEMGADIV